MSRFTLKSSTVFVAVNEETRVFRSVDEVPPEWRRKFERAKGGLKPQTILIADRKGREELMRAVQGQPSLVRTRWTAPRLSAAEPEIHRWTPQQIAIEAAFAAVVALSVWAAFLR